MKQKEEKLMYNEYKDNLTRFDEVNFHQKLLNSTINFTEKEVERVNKDLQDAKSRISNYAILLFKVKDNVDLKNTKQREIILT